MPVILWMQGMAWFGIELQLQRRDHLLREVLCLPLHRLRVPLGMSKIPEQLAPTSGPFVTAGVFVREDPEDDEGGEDEDEDEGYSE